MVIEILIIGDMPLQLLLRLLDGHFPGAHFPLEFFQFSPGKCLCFHKRYLFHLAATLLLPIPQNGGCEIRGPARPNCRRWHCWRSRRCWSCRNCWCCCNSRTAKSTRPPVERHQHNGTFSKTHPKNIYFRFLSLSMTPRIFPSSLSIFSPRLWTILSNFFLASSAFRTRPLAVVKHPSGFCHMMM